MPLQTYQWIALTHVTLVFRSSFHKYIDRTNTAFPPTPGIYILKVFNLTDNIGESGKRHKVTSFIRVFGGSIPSMLVRARFRFEWYIIVVSINKSLCLNWYLLRITTSSLNMLINQATPHLPNNYHACRLSIIYWAH